MPFGLIGKQKEKDMKWNEIKSMEDVNFILQRSENKPMILFKHSTRCAISAMALSRFERDWNISNETAEPWFLDLIAHRDVSNYIAELTGVKHESPQVIVLKEGKVVHTASHYAIRVGDLEI